MSVLPDIDRSLPDQQDEGPTKVTGTPVSADDPGPDEGAKASQPSEPPRVRTRITSPASRPPAPRAGADSPSQADDEELVPSSSSRKAPFFSELHPEHLAPLAGLFMVAFFFFISLFVWSETDDRNALLSYIVLGSLLGAGAAWFWLKADRLDRVQANFLAAILGGMSLVVLYLGANEFGGDVWRVLVAVVLATLATVCFLLAGVVKRL